MVSAVSGPSFSKADILPALAWSTLPIIADQLAQRIFFKKPPVNRGTDLTLTGLVTCIVVVYFLPSSSPARAGAPVLYIAYRAALYYGNRTPKPARTSPSASPKLPAPAPRSHHHQPARSNSSAAPTAPPKPAAQKPAPPIGPSNGLTPAAPIAPSKSQEEIKSGSHISNPSSAAALIPNITITPASSDASKEKVPPKSGEKKSDAPDQKSASDTVRKQINDELLKHQTSIHNARALNFVMYEKAEQIPVKIKITYLPKKETETDAKQKKETVKDPEVIQTQILINAICLFKLSSKTLSTLSKLTEKYSITEETRFCWVCLLDAKKEDSLFPFDYLPVVSLKTLNTRGSILKIETEEKVFEIKFSRTASQSIIKCIKKLDQCKSVIDVQSRHAYIPVNFKNELAGLVPQLMETFTVSNCYLTPLERQKKH